MSREETTGETVTEDWSPQKLEGPQGVDNIFAKLYANFAEKDSPKTELANALGAKKDIKTASNPQKRNTELLEVHTSMQKQGHRSGNRRSKTKKSRKHTEISLPEVRVKLLRLDVKDVDSYVKIISPLSTSCKAESDMKITPKTKSLKRPFPIQASKIDCGSGEKKDNVMSKGKFGKTSTPVKYSKFERGSSKELKGKETHKITAANTLPLAHFGKHGKLDQYSSKHDDKVELNPKSTKPLASTQINNMSKFDRASSKNSTSKEYDSGSEKVSDESANKGVESGSEKKDYEKMETASKEFESGSQKESDDTANKQLGYGSEKEGDENAGKDFDSDSEKEADEAAKREFELGSAIEADETANEDVELGSENEADETGKKEFELGLEKKADETADEDVELGSEKEIDEATNKQLDYDSEKEADENVGKDFESGSEKKADETANKEFELVSEKETDETANGDIELDLEKETDKTANKDVESGSEKKADEVASKVFELGLEKEADATANKELNLSPQKDADFQDVDNIFAKLYADFADKDATKTTSASVLKANTDTKAANDFKEKWKWSPEKEVVTHRIDDIIADLSTDIAGDDLAVTATPELLDVCTSERQPQETVDNASGLSSPVEADSHGNGASIIKKWEKNTGMSLRNVSVKLDRLDVKDVDSYVKIISPSPSSVKVENELKAATKGKSSKTSIPIQSTELEEDLGRQGEDKLSSRTKSAKTPATEGLSSGLSSKSARSSEQEIPPAPTLKDCRALPGWKMKMARHADSGDRIVYYLG